MLSGGTVDGATRIDGGILTLDAGAIFEPHAALTITNTGWLLLEQDSFKGTIKDFGGSDELDLAKIKFIGPAPDATTATFTQTTGAGGTPSGPSGFPFSRPSFDRHLYDRELRTRERWCARHAGYFCPQCLAGRSRIAVHHQIDLRRSETMSKMDYRANGASRIRSLVADCFSEREAQGGRTEKCWFMGPFRRLPWCSDISAVGVQADIRASSKYSERPMCDI